MIDVSYSTINLFIWLLSFVNTGAYDLTQTIENVSSE